MDSDPARGPLNERKGQEGESGRSMRDRGLDQPRRRHWGRSGRSAGLDAGRGEACAIGKVWGVAGKARASPSKAREQPWWQVPQSVVCSAVWDSVVAEVAWAT